MTKHIHEFYCPTCGNTTIPVHRKTGQLRKKFHRKKMYCYHCKKDINTIEVRNEWEANEFKINYQKGLYADEK